MISRDKGGILLADVQAALGLLTRLPVPHRTPAPRNAAWAWPIAGAVVGAIAGMAAWIAGGLGLPAGLCAALALGVQAMLTGAMHEDGLADCADGFWGGWTRERRLEIMKDSRIGTYGVLALILVTLARWTALTTLIASGAGMFMLIAAGALSRAPMALIQSLLPNARGSGLSSTVGRPPLPVALAGAGLALVLALPGLGLQVFPAAFVLGLAALATALVAKAKIGGQTGDVLGAAQQTGELAVLATAAALI